ncbi:MAG: hypothetical protein MAG581_02265 [Deltaproteobacteria bacterium]|jgi:hypothetical protein|nr:hypothetical protein [Deltaproteobacteria bacterium]
MSYRVTDVNFDPEREDEFYAYADGLRDQLKAVDGLQLVHVIDVDKGQSVFIARYDNEESAVAANETIQGILAGMGEFMTAPPNRRGGPISWEWER